ncbi:helix-turn-helix transcriptional regulator [Clostridium sp. KNHs214]|uniref:helix-turn-helix domain-containing protein n=1 Tax=Clostridium sp. KNHs214 TaxID=1540257 RepID=UPI00054E8485|nr:helix-turn-helix transcriptional regulator [Clostridium sp. KNHs214]
MNTKVITAGEKLKDIRKKYNIKQYELSGDKLTRNMISMIETDKARLTKYTAKILLENIHKICKDRNIEYDITLEYLLECPEYQAKGICNEFIQLLNSTPQKVFESDFQKTLNEIESLLDKYKLKKEKTIIYTKLGEIFKISRNFHKAYTYLLRAFENSNDLFNDLELIGLIIDITCCCNNLKKYKEVLDFSRLAYIYMDNIPKDQEYKLKYNNIIAYKNLKNYNSALKEIEEIEYRFKNELDSYQFEKIKVLILKANCLKEKNFYIDALKIHKEILTLCQNDIEMYLVTLCNILEIYIEMNDSKNLKEYVDRCTSHLNQYENLQNKKYSSEIYNDIGLGFYTINKFEMSKPYFNNAIKEAKKYKKVDIILSSMEKLLNIAADDKATDEVDNLKNQLVEIMSLNLLPINNALIFEFIKYYNDLGDRETINDIVNFTKSLFLK